MVAVILVRLVVTCPSHLVVVCPARLVAVCSAHLVAVCPARLETVCPARLVAVSSPFGGSVSSPIGGCTLTTPFGGAVSSLFSSCCPASCKFGLLAAVCSTCWWMASCRCRPAGVVCPMAATVLLSFAAFLRYNEIAKLRCRDINFAADHNIMSVHIQSSKTDQFQQGDSVLVARTGSKTCPVSMLER